MLKKLATPLLLAAAAMSLAAQTSGPDSQAPAPQESQGKEAAQEESKPKESKPKQEERPSVLDELAPMFGEGGEGDDLRAEMEKLFKEVETNLIAIDDELAMAGAGEMELGKVANSGLEKLLRSQKDKSNQVIADIDRILEITEQLGGT